MKKTISVGDLFNLIARDEQPKRIEYNGTQAFWDKQTDHYKEDNDTYISFLCGKKGSKIDVTYEVPTLEK